MFRFAIFIGFVAILYLVGQQPTAEPSAQPIQPNLEISSI
jgi:hypothetical protein